MAQSDKRFPPRGLQEVRDALRSNHVLQAHQLLQSSTVDYLGREIVEAINRTKEIERLAVDMVAYQDRELAHTSARMYFGLARCFGPAAQLYIQSAEACSKAQYAYLDARWGYV